ncbi:unnamed protein product [Owenia fusiformis]|uniref:AMP-dependent synthetase/ligase domain-containing protein n=1 Tax=Owenia fusiformis TaxID=6347 RepID=A0A8S4N4I6_OWEFU|nr:unnamed protein product [Owenia fusiformis]
MAIKSAFPDVFIPDESLAEFVFDKARDYGDRTALVNGTTEEIVTYSQFRQYVIAIGSGLLRHGVKQGDIVAMYSTNSPEFAMMFFGALAMGATVTMVNPLYTADELERQLNDSTASFIFTNGELSHNVRKAVKQIPTMKAIFSLGLCEGFIAFQSLCEDDGSLLDAPRHMPSSSVAVLPYSSGTTGLSKGVMLTHRNLVGNILQYSYNQFVVDPKPHADVMLGLLPFFHSFGMTATMCVGMALGVKVVTMAKYEPQRMLYLVEKYKITILQAVPPIVLFLAKSESVSKYNLSSLRVIQSGAAPLGSDTEQEVMKRLPTCVVIQGYGLTETSPACFMAPKNLIKPGSIGVLCPNTEAKIVDPETRSTVGPGIEGEVCLRGSQIMKGYFNNTVATAASIDTDGWFSTGCPGRARGIACCASVNRGRCCDRSST